MTQAQKFHKQTPTVAQLLAVGAREDELGFVFPDGSFGGFGLYENGALIQTDEGKDFFVASDLPWPADGEAA